MLDFVTIGGATRDIFFKVVEAKKKRIKSTAGRDHLLLPYGEKLIARESYYTYGGGAANAAVCLARLGAKTGVICNIGIEGTGSLLQAALKKEKVNTSLVTRDKKHHTGLSIFVVGQDNEHTGILERGANNYLSIKMREMPRTKWFYITSLTGDSAKALPQIFKYAAKNKIKIAFNPGSQQLAEGRVELERYIKQAEILSLNLEEAERLACRGQSNNKREILLAAASLGAKITLVTDGGTGSYAIMDGKVYSQPAVKTTVADTTGAGDSFGATFAFSVARGHDLRYSLKIAAINSSSVVSFMGAQQGLMSYREIKEAYDGR